MRTNYHIGFTFLVTILLTITNLSAQTDMMWDAYGLGFTLPKGMQVTQNDGETFTAEKKDLILSIVPVSDWEITEEDLAEAVVAMAEEMAYSVLTDADELELDDLYGYYIEGEKDDTQAVVIAIMDVESASNYLVVIIYDDNSREQALDIAASFYAYDGE